MTQDNENNKVNDVHQLHEELITLKNNLKSVFTESGGAISKTTQALINETLENIRTRVDSAVEKGKQGTEKVDNLVKENPWKTAGIALAVGVVLGMLIRRGRD